MVVGTLASIDWSAPWFAPYARPLDADWRAALNREAQARDLRTATGHPLQFALPHVAGATPYESHITATGQVPTRDDLHDVFNALVWLAWPRAKARLNQLQAEAIAHDGISQQRGPLRDAATLIDENGALVVGAGAGLIDALRARRWRQGFVALRDHWQLVRVIVFGHALLQKLVRPYKALTAHAIFLSVAADGGTVDATLAGRLGPALSPRDLTPLPLAGIPGWHPDNADPAFYDDETVFRRQRGVHDAAS